MYSVLEKEDDMAPARLAVIANACYSPRVIERAAQAAQTELGATF